jgi:hypothetical protein
MTTSIDCFISNGPSDRSRGSVMGSSKEGNQKGNGVLRWVGLAEAKVNAFSVLVV